LLDCPQRRPRLHEEILAAGGVIEGGRLVRAKDDAVRAWLAAAGNQLVPEPAAERLAELWPELSEPLARALAARAEQRVRSMRTLLARRSQEEIAAMGAILDELERSIRAALDDTEAWEQASLFEVAAERDQLRRDREALAERLAQIPAQREQEAAALRRRYADPTARHFPAAVTFLVPAAIAHGARR
jgi:hypothetical protein